jgi:hypothetical protein
MKIKTLFFIAALLSAALLSGQQISSFDKAIKAAVSTRMMPDSTVLDISTVAEKDVQISFRAKSNQFAVSVAGGQAKIFVLRRLNYYLQPDGFRNYYLEAEGLRASLTFGAGGALRFARIKLADCTIIY